jgi:hypothetical protein
LRPTTQHGLSNHPAQGVSYNDGAVESFSGHRVLDILRQHLEIEKLNRRASAIAKKIKRDRMQARLREAPQLGLPNSSCSTDPMQKDNRHFCRGRGRLLCRGTDAFPGCGHCCSERDRSNRV